MLYSMLKCFSFNPAPTALSALSKMGYMPDPVDIFRLYFGKAYPNNNSKTNAKILRSYFYCLMS